MKLRTKILAGYGLTLLLMGFLIGWAVYNLVSLGQASKAILHENYRSIQAAANMLASLENQDHELLASLGGFRKLSAAELIDNKEEFTRWLTRAQDNITIPGEAELVARIDQDFRQYQLRLLDLQKLMRADPAESGSFYTDSLTPPTDQVRRDIIALRDLNQATMSSASDNAERVALKAVISTLAVGFLAILLGLLFSLTLSARLVRPLHSMVGATQSIASGNYSTRLTADRDDELGKLASEFNVMAEKLEHYNSLNIEKIVSEKGKSDAMLASIRDGIIVLDTGLRITDLNQSARRILGLEGETVIGRPVSGLIKDEKFHQALLSCFVPETTPARGDGSNVVPIGTSEQTFFFSYTLSPIETGSGDYLGVVILLRDITRLKELERLKSEFVMAASHELKTPLTSIGMSVDLLLERTVQKLDSREQLLLSTAREEVGRLKALVNELLDLSRIETGKIDMDMVNCPLGTLFEKVATVFDAQAREKKVELSVSLPEDIPEVHADPNKITWVLTNLIGNSLRYVEKGGHVILSAERAGNQVQVSVSDDGSGIPIEYQSRVFDKFVRVREGNESGGSGLGLAICKEIVRAHKGTIWVDSMPGKGCTFSFTLPTGS